MSTHRAHRIALALACVVLPVRAAAQALRTGAHVRVMDLSSNHPLMVGTLVRLVGDSVTILSTDPLSSTPYTVWGVGGQHRLEVRAEEQLGWTVGGLLGSIVGAAVGSSIGQRSPGSCSGQPSSGFFPCIEIFSPAAIGAMGGIIAGGLVGGIVGHVLMPGVWQSANHPAVRVGIAPAPGRGVLLSASVAF